MKAPFRHQVASDVDRDGLGVELVDERGNVVAEVFRSDREKTTKLSVFAPGIPNTTIDDLLRVARAKLGTYEDGTPIGKIGHSDV